MNFIKTLFALLLLILTQAAAHAAVNQVTYKLVYNPVTCRYEVYMTIANGSTTSIEEQEAYTAQVTIVVPTGTVVGTASIVSYEPKTGSLSGGVLSRTTPKAWTSSNIDINDSALLGYDLYSFVPTLTNAYYAALNTNDSVLLFSIPIATTACGTGVRLWKNNEIQGMPASGGDPGSTNFGGLDFNNGHVFSSSTFYQAYVGNGVSRLTLPKPTVSLTPTLVPGVSFADTSVSALGSSCAGPLRYAWTGPNSFTSTTAHIFVSPLTTPKYGTYTLTVTDARGCSASAFSTIVAPTPLPIDLISFMGAAINCTAMLDWTAVPGHNLKQFDVQFSDDAIHFATVGQVACGESSEVSNYSFSHYQANDKGYYRLKMVDQNGNYTMSPTVRVIAQCDDHEITIFPNPTSGQIRISGIEAGDLVKIFNFVGQMVLAGVSPADVTDMDLGPYPAGSYCVQVLRQGLIKKNIQIIKQ